MIIVVFRLSVAIKRLSGHTISPVVLISMIMFFKSISLHYSK